LAFSLRCGAAQQNRGQSLAVRRDSRRTPRKRDGQPQTNNERGSPDTMLHGTFPLCLDTHHTG